MNRVVAAHGRCSGALSVVAVVVVLMSAACSSAVRASPTLTPEDEKTGQQILLDAAAALARAQEYHFEGATFTPDACEISADTAGPGETFAHLECAATLEYLIVGTREYIRSQEFFQQEFGPAAATRAGGKWVLLTPAPVLPIYDSLDVVRSISNLVASLRADAKGASRRGTEVVDGRRTVAVFDASNRLIDVALDGPPLPVRVSSGSSVDLSRFGIPIVFPGEPSGAPTLSSIVG